MFALVPVFAGLVALAAWQSRRKYPQHLYFAMHVHAAWFFAGAVAALAGIVRVPYVKVVVTGAASLYAVTYFVLAFRRAYNTTVARAVLGTTAVAGTYMIAVVLTIVALALTVLIRG